jgi:hypothetical protein
MVFRALLMVMTTGILSIDAGRAAAADPPPSINGGGVSKNLDLKKQLELGLRARRDVEFQYIDTVVKLVEAGTLPENLVTSTFIWARRKPARQLQYFQFALRARAKKLGIFISDLSDQAVGMADAGTTLQ